MFSFGTIIYFQENIYYFYDQSYIIPSKIEKIIHILYFLTNCFPFFQSINLIFLIIKLLSYRIENIYESLKISNAFLIRNQYLVLSLDKKY